MGPLVDQYWFWALLAAIFAALTAIFAKVGVSDLHPDFATFLRTIVVLVVLGLIVLGTGVWRTENPVSAKSWIFLTLSGLATGASWLAYFRALKLGDAARVAPLDKLSIVLVAVFAAIFLGEKLNWQNWLGVGLIALGAFLVTLRA